MAKKITTGRRLSPGERRNLDVEISFIEGVVRRDPCFVDALRILGDDYTRRGRYVDGLRVDEQLVQLRPDDSMVLYNLACSYSLTGQLDQAAAALDKAITQGYTDFKWLAKDPDLRKLRDHALFEPIRKRIKSLSIKIS